MADGSPKQRGVPPLAGQTLRADVDRGALSADCGALVLRGMDRQMGLTARLAAAIRDTRPQSSGDPPWRALLAQRISQSAAGEADAHDAHRRRRAPVGTRGVERAPWEPTHDGASAPMCARLAHRVDRKDVSRRTTALVAPCRTGEAAPPAAIVRALDPADAPPDGQQAGAVSPHHAQTQGELPRGGVAGTSQALVTAYRRPGTRPTGADHALLGVRRLSSVRRRWPSPHILVRGESPLARSGSRPSGRVSVTSDGLRAQTSALCTARPRASSSACPPWRLTCSASRSNWLSSKVSGRSMPSSR